MKVSLIQMSVVPDKAANLAHARALIAAAAEAGADIAVLPEMFCCEYRNRAFVENRESAGGPAWAMLSAAAAENGVYLVGGSLPEEEGGRLYNSSFVFDRAVQFDILVANPSTFMWASPVSEETNNTLPFLFSRKSSLVKL